MKASKPMSKTAKTNLLLFFGNLLILGGSAALYLYLRETVAILPCALVLLCFNAYFIGGRSLETKEKAKVFKREFVRLFTYFGIYMDNGYTVYPALREAKRFTVPAVQGLVDNLLEKIDVDKSITPFVEFAEAFDSLSIRQVMVSVYQMVDEGYSGAYLTQFRSLFDSLANETRKETNASYDRRLGTICVTPLIGSALSMVMITVAIVDIIGGVVSVV